MCNFQRKINQLEDRSLEQNLIFQGISETIPDDVKARVDKIYNAISNTINRDTQEERLRLAREVEIITRKPYGFMQSSFWVIMMVHVMVCGDL